jgi:Zn-dependent protease
MSEPLPAGTAFLAGARCSGCGSELAPALLACPVCQQLVHRGELERLATVAARARAAGDATEELTAWRAALPLLPPASKQHASITAKVEELSTRIADAAPATPTADQAARRSWLGKTGAAAGAVGLLLWKLKALLIAGLGKAKLLLTGLTKASTLLTMLAALGVYWAAWGWKFAAGLVAAIYVHEMGHVAALRRFGIPATAPMFLPGIGAVVRLKQRPATPREDAAVGLAGPLWGLGACVAAALVHLVTGWGSWAAIATVSAWINLFNLLPLGPLDGGRAFAALSRPQRWLALAAIAAALWISRDGMLALLALVAGARCFATDPPAGDTRSALTYAGLVLALAALLRLPVPLPG